MTTQSISLACLTGFLAAACFSLLAVYVGAWASAVFFVALCAALITRSVR